MPMHEFKLEKYQVNQRINLNLRVTKKKMSHFSNYPWGDVILRVARVIFSTQDTSSWFVECDRGGFYIFQIHKIHEHDAVETSSATRFVARTYS